MRKFIILIMGALLLCGCAIPVPLQIASWALDGISMLATQKSVADHGLSLLAQKDCAVWRGVTAGELCRNAISSDAMVASDAVEAPTKPSETRSVSFAPSLANTSLSNLKHKKESSHLLTQSRTQVEALPSYLLRSVLPGIMASDFKSPNSSALAKIETAYRIVPNKSVTVVYQKMTTPAEMNSIRGDEIVPPIIKVLDGDLLPIKRFTSDIKPAEGIYFVVGSFRNANNAQRLFDSITKLEPSVLIANPDGSDIFRVVVGPVISGRERDLHRSLSRNGLEDTWAIRVDPSEWRFAKLPKTPSKVVIEFASLQ